MDTKLKEEALASNEPDKAMKQNLKANGKTTTKKPRKAPKRHDKADEVNVGDGRIIIPIWNNGF